MIDYLLQQDLWFNILIVLYSIKSMSSSKKEAIPNLEQRQLFGCCAPQDFVMEGDLYFLVLHAFCGPYKLTQIISEPSSSPWQPLKTPNSLERKAQTQTASVVHSNPLMANQLKLYQ